MHIPLQANKLIPSLGFALFIASLQISGCSGNSSGGNKTSDSLQTLRSNISFLSQQQHQQVEELAISKLNQINAKSIVDNREFCGYIGIRADKKIVSSPILGGEIESCEPSAPDGWTLLASFHSHGAYTADLNSEYPSSDDMLGDRHDRTLGYISTPGGRIWKVDGQKLTAAILCENDCIAIDPKYNPDNEDVSSPVTLNFLYSLEQQNLP